MTPFIRGNVSHCYHGGGLRSLTLRIKYIRPICLPSSTFRDSRNEALHRAIGVDVRHGVGTQLRSRSLYERLSQHSYGDIRCPTSTLHTKTMRECQGRISVTMLDMNVCTNHYQRALGESVQDE